MTGNPMSLQRFMSPTPASSARKKHSKHEHPDNSPLPGQAFSVRPLAGDAIYERIVGAIMEHRLTPGTKLVEEKLAGIFGVNRTRVREVLARLAAVA